MNFGKDEEKHAKYSLNSTNTMILTNRRLIVVSDSKEESYPISKITAVRFVFTRLRWGLVTGIILLLLGIGGIMNRDSSGILFILVGGILFYIGWRGKFHFQITHMGGEQSYTARGKDPEAIRFLDCINDKLL